MIRELNKDEIKTVEDYIQLVFKDNPEYKNYFAGEPKRNYAQRGFLIGNNDFYIDVEVISGVNYVGMCKLQTAKNNFLTDIITLFERLYNEYGCIGIYRVAGDERIGKLHNHIKKRFQKRGDIIKELNNEFVSVLFFQKGGAGNDLKE